MLFQLIHQHELASDFPLITLTLQSQGWDEANVRGQKAIDTQGRPTSGYNPTQQAGENRKKESEMNLIWFDLEGSLPSQHNAYERMKPFPRDGKTLEVISRGDALQISVTQCFQFLSRDINVGGLNLLVLTTF